MTYILTNAKETCRYDEANGKFLLGGATSGSQSLRDALAQASGTTSVDQFPCEVTVRYIDQLFSSRYEVIRGLYNSADNSITRDRTISSTTGTGAISFDPGTGADNLVIYGTTSHEAFGIITLQDIYSTTSTNYATASTTQLNPTSDWVTVVPTNPNSYIDILCISDLRLTGLSSADSVRGYSRFRRQAVGATELDVGNNVFAGFINQDTPNASPVEYEPTTMMIRLNSASRNDDDEWVFRTVGRVDFANNSLNTYGQQWWITEKLAMGA